MLNFFFKLPLSGDLPDPYTFNEYVSNIRSKLSNIIKNNYTCDSFKYIDTQVNLIFVISTCVDEVNHLISHTIHTAPIQHRYNGIKYATN